MNKNKIYYLLLAAALAVLFLRSDIEFHTDAEMREREQSRFEKDQRYVDLLRENKDYLENSIRLYEENQMLRDEANKLSVLVEQYEMGIIQPVEE